MTSACAAFVPQVTTPPTTKDGAQTVKTSPDAALRFIEGRPNGILMSINWPRLPEGTTHLHIERRYNKEKPTIIQIIKLEAKYRRALADKGLKETLVHLRQRAADWTKWRAHGSPWSISSP